MSRRWVLLLGVLSACTVQNTEDRFAASGRVVTRDGSADRGIGGALIQACSVNPISFLRFMDDPSICEKEELVRSAPDGTFTITSHKELRLGGLFFGPAHGSGEDYIYTVLVACHKDGFMGHEDVKYPNTKDLIVQTYAKQAPDSIDSKRCARLWNRGLGSP